jgi:tRNA A-37 threonylcarbamoyl transferase component Bud32
MPCPSDSTLFDASLATGDTLASDREHLATCPACQARVEAFGRTLDSNRTVEGRGLAQGAVGPGVTVGAYVVSRRLGVGAMGAVYAAWDPRLEREVALKLLHLDAGDLVTEARLLAKLSHPNVVTVHEVFSWHDRLVLVMELARGQTVREWLAERPRRAREILDVFTQCAAGLGAAHAAGVVHRDFKPDNALVDDTGRARLLDFGLAMPARTGTAGIAGSPAYLALAQLEGAPADPSSDQFAWWASLYEALSGRRPVDATSWEQLREARRRGAVDLSLVPRWLRPALARGLSNDPTQRFATMAEAARAVSPARRAQRLWLATAALAVLGLAAVGVVSRPAGPCAALRPLEARLSGRTVGGPLAQAVTAWRATAQACDRFATEARDDHARCLARSGQELELALTVAAELPEVERGRLLRRVLPAERCARQPLPRLETGEPERPRLASLRAQARFDALRAEQRFDEALAFATAHRAEADASGSTTARAWARINEAAALSVTSQLDRAVARLREIESLPSLGQREETWTALSRWLLECHVVSEAQCEAIGERAGRLAREFDEPWVDAYREEIAMRWLGAPLDATIVAWQAVPGAEQELRRALVNALGALVVSDDLVARRRGLTLASPYRGQEPRLDVLIWQLEAALALQESDLARAGAALARLETIDAKVPNALLARNAVRYGLLVGAGRLKEAVAFLESEPWRDTSKRAPFRNALTRATVLHELGDPRAAEAQAQVELIEPSLNPNERGFYDVLLSRLALARGDASALASVDVPGDDDLLRRWHLAVLRNDPTAERAVLDEAGARADDDEVALRLRLERPLAARRFAEVAQAAAELRGAIRSAELEAQVRLVEATARWELGDREAACRVMSRAVLGSQLLPRERARAQALLRDCPRIGLSEWVE